eukprot:TRINITY_DN20914_c0_g1_i13.p1 TRINITY_DN20914_c0_g1~~TRINITY_DN20914_c0_g1_i13.p1  ORF type:complete len:202 (+),score=49.13 TRINITY_DN20914_c0_g1_i13:111-716(+)
MGSDKHQADDQVIPVEGQVEESDKKNEEDHPATIPSPTKESIIKKVKLAYLREKIKDRIEDMSETVEHWGNTLHFIQACQNFSDKYKLVIGNSTDSNEQETGSGKDNQATEIESLKKKIADLEAKKTDTDTDENTKKEIDMRLRMMGRKLEAKNIEAMNDKLEAETVMDEDQKEINALMEGLETAKKDLQEINVTFQALSS